jgi:mannose-6-phosphate isomerase-like protein (cupin superfamily)
MEKVNLHQKFGLFQEQWSPRIIGELNGQQVKIAKVQGEFVWHKHDEEDELFMVIKGKLILHFRDRIEELSEGEIFIVSKGVEHKPMAEEETWIMMFEPASTLNTGNVLNERTKAYLEKI